MHGLRHAMYGEIILFENGVKGMVQNITDDGIGAILFDEEGSIGEGSKVVGTGKQAGIPVSDEYLGRVINALGEPIDGGTEIHAGEYRPIEEPAPGIVERKSVSEPLQTGILSIDSMFPIGRGQRELIIGDRQTGKTSIAVDTILNQKGKNCICIYVAIGQKASTIAGLVNTLRQHGAMEYSIVVSSTASDPAPLQYIAPYSATSLAEYFMHKGQDVLIVYDDLSKHAVACRFFSEEVRDVKPTPEMSSTCIPDFWKEVQDSRMSLAEAPLRHFLLLRRRTEMFPPIFRRMSFPLQTDRFSWRATCSSKDKDRLSTLACPCPVSAVPLRPRP